MGDRPASPPDPEPAPPLPGAASSAAIPAPRASAQATCANHPGRRAIGRCPTCGKLVCDECHVRLDGILHCKACLAVQARKLERPGGRRVLPRVATTAAAAVVALAALVAVRAALSTAGFLGGRGTRLFATTFETPHARPR